MQKKKAKKVKKPRARREGNDAGNARSSDDEDGPSPTPQGENVDEPKDNGVNEGLPDEGSPVPPAKELITEYVHFTGCGEKHPLKGLPSKYVVYEQYKSEEQLPRIMEMMTADLSEPYSIFTYRYFINNWPDLCFMAVLHDADRPEEKKIIGSCVCKLDYHKAHSHPQKCIRGYIAMLVVEKQYRGHGLGSTLARYAIQTMIQKNCDEVVLETEVTNLGALRLYENLGFVRDKRLQRYYLNGVDAFRLKLWLTPFMP